jgi:hypothetical protein
MVVEWPLVSWDSNPLAQLHSSNSTAQVAMIVDQQSTTNDVIKFKVNNTVKAGVSTNGIYSLNSLATKCGCRR